MKIKYLSAIILAATALSACTTMSGNTATMPRSESTRLDVKGLSVEQKVAVYSDQLVTDSSKEYATFSNLQIVSDYRTDSFYALSPYGIYAVDGIPVKKYSNSLFGSRWYIHAAQMAVAKVKIPAGKHVVELGQITSRDRKRSDIVLPVIDYKPDTDYISVFKAKEGVPSIHVYTYEQDNRLSRMDRDSIILKDEIISQEVDIFKDKTFSQKVN